MLGPTTVPQEPPKGGDTVPDQSTALEPSNPMNPPKIKTGPSVKVGKEGSTWSYND